jgi:AcrR family transcriptional regulator
MPKDRAKPARLIEKAQASFLEHGFENTSLRRIAHEAGMTTGALYHYFKGKDELFVEVCLHGYRIMLKRLDAAAKLTECQPPAERIVAFLDAYFGFFLEHGGYFELIEQFDREAESLKIGPELRRRVQDASRVAQGRIQEALGAKSPASAAKAELLTALAQGVIQRMRIGAFEQAGVSFGEIRRLCGETIRRLIQTE